MHGAIAEAGIQSMFIFGWIYFLYLNSLSVSPHRGEILFFVSPKKRTQKKGDPKAWPALPVRVPCAPHHFEVLSTSPLRRLARQTLLRLRLAKPARQGGSLNLKMAAVLGQA